MHQLHPSSLPKHASESRCRTDTSDAGALEYWGVGPFNTAHHNCFSDLDPGILKGGWLNYLFQDDAAHYLNFSSNIVYEVKGSGAQETGMIKSVGSVRSEALSICSRCLRRLTEDSSPHTDRCSRTA